jgi:L-aspartate oxidase
MDTIYGRVEASAALLQCDVAIIGGGIAGLSLALNLPPDLHVVLVTKGVLGESNTRYAQGGLAAAVGPDDTAELHLHDTLAAGAGLVDGSAARVLVAEARDALAWLIRQGAEFDERESGREADTTETLGSRYALGHEAAHSRRRVLHAHGDATGAEIERALVAAMRTRPGSVVLEATRALRLVMQYGTCVGVELLREGRLVRLEARRAVVLANGGAGQLWLRTSNPSGATADGLALAARAGATLADLEFAQFHPTVLVPPDGAGAPFLISEAVRGEGAYLRNAAAERFMPRYAQEAELAPRDVVARAILSEMLAEGASSAFLDLRHLPASDVHARFPTISSACAAHGLDLARDLIPVAPAAHYFMGGVATDTWGRTTLPRLYAIGEVACTGVHGANRLASNSLLEGLVFGRRAALAIGRPTSASLAGWPRHPSLAGRMTPLNNVVKPVASASVKTSDDVRARLQHLMWEHVSLRRDEAGLRLAFDRLRDLALGDSVDPETANMLLSAQAITSAALARRESRGAHFRTDFPQRDPALDGIHGLACMGEECASLAPADEGVATYA